MLMILTLDLIRSSHVVIWVYFSISEPLPLPKNNKVSMLTQKNAHNSHGTVFVYCTLVDLFSPDVSSLFLFAFFIPSNGATASGSPSSTYALMGES